MSAAPPAARSPSALTVAVFGVLLLLVGLSQRIVLCTHLDGDTHVEFTQLEGGCCQDPLAAPRLAAAGDQGDVEQGRLETCSHTDLAIQMSPAPQPDPVPQPDLRQPIAPIEFALPNHGPRWPSMQHPPATGPPPRPRAFLAHRRSTLLLL